MLPFPFETFFFLKSAQKWQFGKRGTKTLMKFNTYQVKINGRWLEETPVSTPKQWGKWQ